MNLPQAQGIKQIMLYFFATAERVVGVQRQFGVRVGGKARLQTKCNTIVKKTNHCMKGCTVLLAT